MGPQQAATRGAHLWAETTEVCLLTVHLAPPEASLPPWPVVGPVFFLLDLRVPESSLLLRTLVLLVKVHPLVTSF